MERIQLFHAGESRAGKKKIAKVVQISLFEHAFTVPFCITCLFLLFMNAMKFFCIRISRETIHQSFTITMGFDIDYLPSNIGKLYFLSRMFWSMKYMPVF